MRQSDHWYCGIGMIKQQTTHSWPSTSRIELDSLQHWIHRLLYLRTTHYSILGSFEVGWSVIQTLSIAKMKYTIFLLFIGAQASDIWYRHRGGHHSKNQYTCWTDLPSEQPTNLGNLQPSTRIKLHYSGPIVYYSDGRVHFIGFGKQYFQYLLSRDPYSRPSYHMDNISKHHPRNIILSYSKPLFGPSAPHLFHRDKQPAPTRWSMVRPLHIRRSDEITEEPLR